MSTDIDLPHKTGGDIKRERLAAWNEANATYDRMKAHISDVDGVVAELMGHSYSFKTKDEA